MEYDVKWSTVGLILLALAVLWLYIHVLFGCNRIADVLVPNGVSVDSPAPSPTTK